MNYRPSTHLFKLCKQNEVPGVQPNKGDKMKVALIGATGLVGSSSLNETLHREHQVTALVRRVHKLPQHPNLRQCLRRGYSRATADWPSLGH